MGNAASAARGQRRSSRVNPLCDTTVPALHAAQEFNFGRPDTSVTAPPRFQAEAHRASNAARVEQLGISFSPVPTSSMTLPHVLGPVPETTAMRRLASARRRAAVRPDVHQDVAATATSTADAPPTVHCVPRTVTQVTPATAPPVHPVAAPADTSDTAAAPAGAVLPELPSDASRAPQRVEGHRGTWGRLNKTFPVFPPPHSHPHDTPFTHMSPTTSMSTAYRDALFSAQSVPNPLFSPTDSHMGGIDVVAQQVQHAMAAMDAHAVRVHILLRSWEEMHKRHEEFLVELCEVLTRDHPEFLQVFASGALKDPSRAIVNMIGEALMLVPKPDEFVATLMEVGALHRRFSLREADFVAVRDAFMSLLPKYLPEELQRTHAAAWEPHWRVVIELMLHGCTSARGEWHAAQQRSVHFLEARRVMGDILTCKPPAERAAFMQELLDRAVAEDPSMERFSVLRDRRAAIRAFHGLERLLRVCDDVEATSALMEEVSLQHYRMGLDHDSMRTFRQPFIDTCKKAVQRARRLDQWGVRTPRSLGALWDFGAESWEKALAHTEKVRLTQTDRAPDGSEPFCLMFTDIEASTRLWERNRVVMTDAVEAHHEMIRSIISDCGAYEVKTVGDSFVIAAKDVLIALKVALVIQLKLMKLPIAKGFEMVSDPQGGGPADCWRRDSLRVRIGIHYCRDATAVYDSVQRRYDYYGPCVNCTARVESAASGGQILMTEEALVALQEITEFNRGRPDSKVPTLTLDAGVDPRFFAAVQEVLFGARPLADLITVRDWGQHSFKGIVQQMRLFSVLPKALANRSFVRTDSSPTSSATMTRSICSLMRPLPSFETSGSVSGEAEEALFLV